MVSSTAGVLALIGTLVVFVGLGLRAGRDRTVDAYTSARDSQGWPTLGLSFLAAGMGAWILFAPPEVGAGVGLLGLAGYGVGAALPVLLFALLGPRIRAAMPRGLSLGEFARLRYGRGFAAAMFLVSVAYMLLFVTAELTAVAGVTAIIAGTDGPLTVMAVAAATLAYTSWGGLRASLVTDRWQAGLIVALLAIGAVAALGAVGDPAAAFTGSGLLAPSGAGWETAAVLVIAVTAANMFHQGYWQRVWAAKDLPALRRGAVAGAALTVPVILLVGAFGIVAAGSGQGLEASPVPFFTLTSGLSAWVGLLVIVLGVALVASSVDTLETGMVSLIAAEAPGMRLGRARLVTVAVMVPAVVIAVQGHSVLRLFLIADLLCAAVVVPLLAGLWPRATQAGAIAGAIAGLIGAVGGGAIATGSLIEGLRMVTIPGTLTLPPFAGALIVSTVVTVAVSLLGRRVVLLDDIDRGLVEATRVGRATAGE